jgi:hypothetical protein
MFQFRLGGHQQRQRYSSLPNSGEATGIAAADIGS